MAKDDGFLRAGMKAVPHAWQLRPYSLILDLFKASIIRAKLQVRVANQRAVAQRGWREWSLSDCCYTIVFRPVFVDPLYRLAKK
jgi:hypothetical protein